MRAVSARLIAFLLIAEALTGALRVAGLLPRLGGYDAVAVALILARGGLGVLQFTGGWLIATHRPQGRVIAGWALIGGAVLTPVDVGLGLAPTSIYPWYRWRFTIAYVAYALLAWRLIRPRGSPDGVRHRTPDV